MISRPSARLEVSAAHATVDSNLLQCRMTFEKKAYTLQPESFPLNFDIVVICPLSTSISAR